MKTRSGIARRELLVAGVGAVGLAASPLLRSGKGKGPVVIGRIMGASHQLGHRLREGGVFPEPQKFLKKDVVIVGGGVAGLSAAWKLDKSGVRDFLLLEMESEVGGSAQSGRNEVSAYPWGAHYVPLLTEESTSACEMFADLGVITGMENGLPVYDEYYLCADPHERLYMYGRWHEGLLPRFGVSEKHKEEYRAFFAAMEQFKSLRGSDGLKAFTIPVDKSSRDPSITAFDRQTMSAYLESNGWKSPYLKWHVDYCCRDDYGAGMDQISAWAGIHYFAARSGNAANADPQTVITWPEGNGWIVKQLARRMADRLRPQSLVYGVRTEGNEAEVLYYDANEGVSVGVSAKAVIVAAPRFVAQHLTGAAGDLGMLQYSPWMVANVTAEVPPAGSGAPLSWDNVIYGSKLLGYVTATHQNLNRIQRETVLTYYWPLDHLPPREAREEALARSYEDWRDIVLTELLSVHPELKGRVKSLDVWLWGHGMIRPTPGYIWGEQREAMQLPEAPLFYAHSDMSGISIFEEANYHGTGAAERVMSYLDIAYRSSL
jgi:predicted NAD/FAD-binding protein